MSKVDFTYRGLELFAEFGGYLGLLLGVSVNQLPDLIIMFASFLRKICKSPNQRPSGKPTCPHVNGKA